MNRIIWFILIVIAPLSVLRAAETAVWDTSNNSVTYSTTVDNLTLGSTPTDVSLSQFSAAAAAGQEGGSSGQYTLARVVLSLDGTVYGTVQFQNNGPVTVNPTYDFSGYSRLTYGGYSTDREYYDGNAVSLGSVATGAQTSIGVNSFGTGSVSTPNITSALAGFSGTDTISASLYFPVGGLFSSGGTDFTTTLALRGLANVSVTYYYSEVPEPSSLAMLGVGCVAILSRRRFKHPIFDVQG